MCERVVTAVAETKQVDVTALPPLYDVIDPECLNGIFDATSRGTERSGGRLSFRWAGCRIVVEGGNVTATPEERATPASSAETGAGAASVGQSEGWLD